MYYDPVRVEYVKDYILRIYFEDKTHGEVDFKELIKKVKPYQKLTDITTFQKVYIHPELKVLTWNDDIDYDPIILYYKANKIPFPAEWGEVA